MRLYRIDELRRSAVNRLVDIILTSKSNDDLKEEYIRHMDYLIATCDDENALEAVICYLQSPRKLIGEQK